MHDYSYYKNEQVVKKWKRINWLHGERLCEEKEWKHHRDCLSTRCNCDTTQRHHKHIRQLRNNWIISLQNGPL